MNNYHDLMRRCLSEGEPVLNQRTGEVCYTLVGEQLKFDMADGFPAITTRKLAWNAMVGELLGILQGATSAAQFRALGCKVWDGNANQTPAWLANPARKGTDDLGRSYGSQFCDWSDLRVVSTPQERDRLMGSGYGYQGKVGGVEEGGGYLLRRGINQVEEALRLILTNPTDRRIIISAWRPDEHDRTALPACHMMYTFVPNTRTGRLDLVMHQRSWDVFLAFNIPMCGLLLHLMSRLSGYQPGVVTMQVTNAHVYESHAEQVKTQLGRAHYPAPTLWMDESIQQVAPSEIKGVFKRLTPDQFKLIGYQHHPALTAPMAV